MSKINCVAAESTTCRTVLRMYVEEFWIVPNIHKKREGWPHSHPSTNQFQYLANYNFQVFIPYHVTIYPGIITWKLALKSPIPTGIRIIVQQQTKPKHPKTKPIGKNIVSHKHAFNTAPVSLNAIPNNRVNTNSSIIHVIITFSPFPYHIWNS